MDHGCRALSIRIDLLDRRHPDRGQFHGNKMNQDASRRAEELVRRWNVCIDETRATTTSILLFGKRGSERVVLKVLSKPGDEWCSGDVLLAFSGNGMVRPLEVAEGAVLLERILPGNSLLDLVLAGRDEEATLILADVLLRMSPAEAPETSATVENWAAGFDRYFNGTNRAIPIDLAQHGRETWLELCASPRPRRLLHGDLHHENILFDAARGWLAIDPKGVVGELEFEIGAMLLNPMGRPELFASQEIVLRRVRIIQKALKIDCERILRWAFARAILSAIWTQEDGESLDHMHSSLKLAREIQPTLGVA